MSPDQTESEDPTWAKAREEASGPIAETLIVRPSVNHFDYLQVKRILRVDSARIMLQQARQFTLWPKARYSRLITSKM
jgi:hypothetical protein